MAIDSNKMVTYIDLQYLIDNEDFYERNSFPGTSNQCPTKTEVLDALRLEIGAELQAWASNRLVPRRLLDPADTYWVGIDGVCEQTTGGGSGDNLIGKLYFTGTTTSSVTLNWNDPIEVKSGSTVSNYIVDYKLSSSSSWTTYSTSIPSASRTVTVSSLSSTQNYDFRIRFITNIAEYSNYSETFASTVNAITRSCSTGATWQGSYSHASQIYDVSVTGTGSSFKVWFDPYDVTDRCQVYSGGDLIWDTKYVGSDGLGNNNGLDDAGISENERDLGNESYNPGQNPPSFEKGIVLSTSLLVGNTIRMVMTTPVRGTQWLAEVTCKY